MWRVVSCGLIVLGLAACSATPIQQKYAERFDQLELGATEDEVRALFPDAYRGGQQTAANGKQVQALEFNDRQYDIGCDCFLKQSSFRTTAEGWLSCTDHQ